MSRDAGSSASGVTGTAPPAGGRFVVGNSWDALDGVWPELPPLVSVIVVHYRQQAELDRTLAALARQSYPAERLEVIVVDDGSPTAPTVPDGVRLIVQEDRGFRLSAARNVGVAASSGSVLCFVDADTSPEPDYVLRLTRLPALAPEAVTVGQRKHADFAGVLGGGVAGAGSGSGSGSGPGSGSVPVPVSEPVEVAGPAHELEQPRWLQQAYGWSADLLHADDRSYRHLIGAVTCCTRWFFDEVGGFDESFTSYGGEDWEWAHRAWLAGAVFAHVPGAVAWHDGPDWAGRGAGAGSAGAAGAPSGAERIAREAEEARRQAEKNGETLRLADLIAVRGSRGFGVRSIAVDVCVELVAAGAPISAGAAFVAVDSVLASAPDVTVVVPDEVAAVFEADGRVLGRSTDAAAAALADARVVVTVDGPVRVLPPVDAGASDDARAEALAAAVGLGDDVAGDLRSATDAVGVGSLGTIELLGPSGRVLATVESRRARLRARRWGAGVAFVSHRASVDWLTPVVGEPSVAAYLGGWG
ncbi:glycosyltransferase family 2 protein [Frigoribacterium sp. Leaf186]|uniref:glycosyltransferase family 2 protein n=1 Tax=Frigoribacterium sp. Leaf186 TaxID=1736293 RepID=UPI000A70B665|nr:glycosyltransferase [Frigoribacterium sp. Leaf186]